MFVFVLSSWRHVPRPVPQDLLTYLFCAWFCTRDLCFVLLRVGRGLLATPEPPRPWHEDTGRGMKPPAFLFFLPTKCLVGRHLSEVYWHFVWSANHAFGRWSPFLADTTFLPFSGIMYAVVPSGVHEPILHTRVWRNLHPLHPFGLASWGSLDLCLSFL